VIRISVLLVALAFGPAVAKTACTKTLDYAEFEKRSGTPVHVTKFDMAHLPYDFFCDRLACDGIVEFSGLIDQSGAVRNLRMTANTWDVDPAEHAAFVRARAMAVRYRPPRIDGKPVCVRMRWRYAFGLKP
jgi:hypothetical protein